MPRFLTLLLAMAAAVSVCNGAVRAETLNVYGPGGPLPALKEAAERFGKARGIDVVVTGGPTSQWIDKAKTDADVVYSGSEHNMTDIVAAMDGRVQASSVNPLYLRTSAILVRPGNPAKIRGLHDLFRPGHRVLVVQGAGQTGLWEDMAGRSGEIADVRALRANIVKFASSSAEAKKAWTEDPTLDAWIIWNIWQVANPTLADVVQVEREHRIFRDTGVALTVKGAARQDAHAFADYLASREGAAIFASWGWITEPVANARTRRR